MGQAAPFSKTTVHISPVQKEEPVRHKNDGVTKDCGCGHKKWPKCPHPWRLAYYQKRCDCARNCNCPGNRRRANLNKVAGRALSKTEAQELAEKLRTQWREEAKRKSAPDPRRTVGMLADRYAREHVRRPGRRPGPIAASENYLRIIRRLKIGGRKFEDFPLDSVTADDLEAVREARRDGLHETKRMHADGKTNGRVVLPLDRGGEIGIEHMMALLRHMFAWAAKRNLASATPFKRNGEAAVTVRAEGPRGRDRRLVGDEEVRLLAAAQPHLRDVIVALLDTGCRIGELLSLLWSDVRPEAIVLRAENTKTLRTRAVDHVAHARGARLAEEGTGRPGARVGPLRVRQRGGRADQAGAARVGQHLPTREDRGPQHPRSPPGVRVAPVGVRRGDPRRLLLARPHERGHHQSVPEDDGRAAAARGEGVRREPPDYPAITRRRACGDGRG
jgi:integrase